MRLLCLCVCGMLLLYVSCLKEKDEFAKTTVPLEEGVSALDFLDSTPDVQNDDTIQESYIQSDVFKSDYKNPIQWGMLQFAQRNHNPKKLENSRLITIVTRVRLANKSQDFLPVDMRIGELEHIKKNSSFDYKIYTLIVDFFEKMKTNTLDKALNLMIIKTEIPVISRQILYAVKFAADISEVRVGIIVTIDATSKSVPVRIVRKNKDIESRGEFLFYVVFVDGTWFINAIEGDFNSLLVPYTHSGQFVPLGTTGVTQGF